MELEIIVKAFVPHVAGGSQMPLFDVFVKLELRRLARKHFNLRTSDEAQRVTWQKENISNKFVTEQRCTEELFLNVNAGENQTFF